MSSSIDSIVSADNLEFKVGERTLWSQGSFNIFPGDVISVIGKNGTGKTSLLHILAELQKPSQGTIDWKKLQDPFINKVNLLFQNPDEMFFCSSLREELEFDYRTQRVKDDQLKVEKNIIYWAELFGVQDLLDQHPMFLSQGQKLRAALAVICSSSAQLLLLDEPTSAQDKERLNTLIPTIQKGYESKYGWKPAIVMVSHDWEIILDLADQIWLLHERAFNTFESTKSLHNYCLKHSTHLPLLWKLREKLNLSSWDAQGMIEELSP